VAISLTLSTPLVPHSWGEEEEGKLRDTLKLPAGGFSSPLLAYLLPKPVIASHSPILAREGAAIHVFVWPHASTLRLLRRFAPRNDTSAEPWDTPDPGPPQADTFSVIPAQAGIQDS
jgi:hypothetical protein